MLFIIGFHVLPNASAGVYVNDAPYEFSITYPNGWIVDNSQDFYDYGITISDKLDWTTIISVFYYDNVGSPLSENDAIDSQKQIDRDYCANVNFSTDGVKCSNFREYPEEISTIVFEIDGYRAISTFFTYTMQYDDPNYPGQYPITGTTTNINVGNDVWQIISESDDYVFEKHFDSIAETVSSFRLVDVSESVPTFTPSSNTHYKIYFEELPEWSDFDIDSAVDDATNYWNNRDGITFSRTFNVNDADMYVAWIKNYGHSVLGTYISSAIDVGLGNDLCAGTWQPFSQQTTSETLTHEIGHHLGYDDLEYSRDTSDIMAYSNTNVSYEYEKWTETSMIGYGNPIPICTYENGITYDYRLTSDSNHTYDVFFVPSIGEFDKFIDGDDYRSTCSKLDVRNTNGSCKVNAGWYAVVYVSGGPSDTLAQYELTLSTTNLPGTPITTTSLPPITTNDTPIDSSITSTISASDKFFSAHGNEFTTVTLSGFVPEQFLNNRAPAYLTIMHEGIMIDELKVRITNQGKFSVPFQLSPDAPYGTYVVTARNGLGTFGSTTFSYGISEIIVPPSVSSNYENMSQSGGQNDLPAFKQFASDQYGFSINYPSNWIYEEDYECYDKEFSGCMLSITDDKDYWSLQLNVNLVKDFNLDYTWNSDKQYLDDGNDMLHYECENSRGEFGYDYDCSDYRLLESEVITINGQKGYFFKWSETDEYDNGTYERVIAGSIEIPINDRDIWQIFYTVLDEYSDYNLPLIEQSISSFKLHSANAQVSESSPTNEIENNMCGAGTVLKNGICVAACGEGTVYKDGKCEMIQTSTSSPNGGGCLIATAAFGSEMAPQVQFLRELRDNTVLQTSSGATFMNGFNQFYYSFSPQIADYERENPVFKEAVKVTLTPLLTSLTLLNYVDVNTEEEMLGYGIGIILLNIGMYFVAPAVLIISLKKRLDSFRGHKQ